jgi:hypothetical protein
LESIRAKIAKHGHAVQQVAPDDEGSGWSYTIGLHGRHFRNSSSSAVSPFKGRVQY